MNLEEVQQLAKRARERGMDPVERLASMGLILTDQRHVELVREACLLLADRLEQASLQQIMGGNTRPMLTDVKYGIVDYIRRNFSEHSVEFPMERRMP